MRVVRFEPKGGEDATIRNAEALFESRTVLEIRSVEARTRKEIEEKKEELRQLVGASYRDLIESADSIVMMKKSCEAVADNIRRMEAGFESLKQTIVVAHACPEADVERGRRERLYGIGSRVKYLVDTPEKIWGCLDEHMYLEGSERYLRAKEVHSLLSETSEVAEKELLANFPLLRHQWPLVETFRGQISQRSREQLQEAGLQVGDYAVALAATAIIDELTSQQVFSLFLDTRKSWLRSLLRGAVVGRDRVGRDVKTGGGDAAESGDRKAAAVGESSQVHSTAAVLKKLVFMIQSSLCHVGQLFLELSNGKAPLLFSTVLTAPPGSQLFGGIPNPEREVRLWKAHREKLESSMGSLAGKYITEACMPWLQECAEEVLAEGGVLLEEINSVAELSEIEEAILEDLATQSAMAPSLEWLKGAFGRGIDSPWDCVCQLLLGEPVNIWDAIFEAMFVRRAKNILDAGFADIKVGQMLDECLAAVKPSTSALKYLSSDLLYSFNSSASQGSVPQIRQDFPHFDLSDGASGALWKATSDEKGLYGTIDSFFSPDVARVKESVDVRMKRILDDLLGFLQGPQGSRRVLELAPYLQEQCHKCASTVISELESRLESLSESMSKVSPNMRDILGSVDLSAVTWSSRSLEKQSSGLGKIPDASTSTSIDPSTLVEKSLFLGRLAAALRLYSSSLPLLLGSPSVWLSKSSGFMLGTNKGGALVRRNSWFDHQHAGMEGAGRWKRGASIGGDVEGTSKLLGLQRSLRRLSIAAHSMWVACSTEQLSACLVRDLFKDECLSTSHPLKGWEETVLKQEEEGGNMVEMKMALPAMPSPYAVAFLFAACQEIRHIGGHVLDRAVLRMFAWSLSGKVFSAYDNLIADSSAMNSRRISEKGLLQLLFDVRLLADVLSGGQNIRVDNFDSLEDERLQEALSTGRKNHFSQSEASSSARSKWAVKITLQLSSRLDPIDWATYEPHLWENKQRFYQRSAVLFGALIQLNRLYTDSVQRLPSSADTNVLNMSATVPRFTYLPISAPNLSSNGSTTPFGARRKDDVGGGSWKSYTNGDDASKFSFEDSPSLASTARPLLKSIMGQVGSKFGEGTLKLGSMLSDGQVGRFKDKSALAISTFGDMYAAGLFSSLTSSASKTDT